MLISVPHASRKQTNTFFFLQFSQLTAFLFLRFFFSSLSSAPGSDFIEHLFFDSCPPEILGLKSSEEVEKDLLRVVIVEGVSGGLTDWSKARLAERSRRRHYQDTEPLSGGGGHGVAVST